MPLSVRLTFLFLVVPVVVVKVIAFGAVTLRGLRSGEISGTVLLSGENIKSLQNYAGELTE
jgi:hypothetical protein